MTRAVLVAGRNQLVPAAALDRIAALGYDLVARVDPNDHRTAHQLVADDAADVILYVRPGDLPSVVHLSTSAKLAEVRSGAGQSATTRRPQLLTEVVGHGSVADSKLEVAPALRRASDRRSLRRRRAG